MRETGDKHFYRRDGQRRVASAEQRGAYKIPQIHPSIIIPSIHPSNELLSDRAMKRPHDYSSPDSDTDEFIDVGQEDGFW